MTQGAPLATLNAVEVTVLMPCLNEARTVAICVKKAVETCAARGIAAEVLIADNGSTDGSQALATTAGARVIDVPLRGYGAAIRAGVQAAHGRLVVMGDADDSYDFGDVPLFVDKLREGAALVMGSRMRGKIHPGAMPTLHRFLGNPVLTWILNLFFSAGISDAHCGMRGFSRDAILALELRTNGMELASEMIVRAAQEGLKIGEVPTSLRPDGRGRPPHLRTWRDGWRHLRFLLLFSPLWLFLVPGLAMAAIGLFLTGVVATTGVTLFGHTLDTHFSLLGSMLAIVGAQLCTLAVYAKAVFVLDGIGKSAGISRLLRAFQLEAALLAGLLLIVAGLGIDGWILRGWLASPGDLGARITHLTILGGTLAALGVEVVFAAFFLSVLQASRARKWV